jgi:hypothetical protein
MQALWSWKPVDIRGLFQDKRGFLDDTPAVAVRDR